MQPHICDSMDMLLSELATQEDIRVHYSHSYSNQRSSASRKSNFRPKISNNKGSSVSSKERLCVLCKAAGRPSDNHDISACWHLSRFEKNEIIKSLRLEIEVDVNDENVAVEEHEENSISRTSVVLDTTGSQSGSQSIRKVHCGISPYIFAFHRDTPCQVVVDTGATSSVVLRAFLAAAARSADKSPLNVREEAKFSIDFAGMNLAVTAVVIDAIDCDLPAGISFCKEHDVRLRLKDELVFINNLSLPYGARGDTFPDGTSSQKLLRNGVAQVILPGEYLEIHDSSLPEGEVALEPRFGSLCEGEWLVPFLTRVIGNVIRIPNNTRTSILLK